MASIDSVGYGPYGTEARDLSAPRRGDFVMPGGTDNKLAKPGAAGETAAAGDIAALPAGVLAAQEFGSEPVAERTARRQGQLLLRQLKLLQIAMLGDGPADAARSQLAGLAAALEESITPPIDPRLRAVLSTLALRARIELARPGI